MCEPRLSIFTRILSSMKILHRILGQHFDQLFRDIRHEVLFQILSIVAWNSRRNTLLEKSVFVDVYSDLKFFFFCEDHIVLLIRLMWPIHFELWWQPGTDMQADFTTCKRSMHMTYGVHVNLDIIHRWDRYWQGIWWSITHPHAWHLLSQVALTSLLHGHSNVVGVCCCHTQHAPSLILAEQHFISNASIVHPTDATLAWTCTPISPHAIEQCICLGTGTMSILTSSVCGTFVDKACGGG